MSERYDTWGQSGYPSWVMNRYSSNPNVELIHETGGQLYNNFLGVMGHPISLISRAQANQADFVYLYAVDIETRNVERFYHPLIEQMGNRVSTNFFCRYGYHPMTNDIISGTYDYYNFWSGLWPAYFTLGVNGAPYTEVNGEKAFSLQLAGGSTTLDLDDRARYHGMYGAVLKVEYYDSGFESFAIRYQDEDNGGWRTLGQVQKANSGDWKVWEHYVGTGFGLIRNDGIDPYNDIFIIHIGGNTTYLRTVEVDFIGARDWLEEILVDETVTANSSLVGNLISRTVSLPPNSNPSTVRIPIASEPTFGLTSVIGDVYATIDGEMELITTRKFSTPEDGEWFEIPVAGVENPESLTVMLSQASNEIRWYRNEQGDPALQVMQLQNQVNENISEPAQSSLIDSNLQQSIIVDLPFNGFSLGLSGPGEVQAQVYRNIGDSEVLISDLILSSTDAFQMIPFHFEPQPADSFYILLNPVSGSVNWGIEGSNYIIQPLLLERKYSVNAPRVKAPGEAMAEWTTSSNPALSTWTGDTGFTRWERNGNLFETRIQDLYPVLVSQENLNIETRPSQNIHLRMKNMTGCNLARIWWREDGQEFDPSRSSYLPLTTNDTHLRDYVFDVGMEPNWQGTISQLMIEPVSGLLNTGIIAIESIAVRERTILKQWTFDDAGDLFEPVSQIQDVSLSNGSMVIDFLNSNGRVQCWESAINFDAQPGQKITIRLKNESSATSIRLFWRAKASGYSGSATINISSFDTDYQTYEIEPALFSQWNGTLVQLMIEPGRGAFFPGRVLIDEIAISQSDTNVNLTPTKSRDFWLFY